MMEYLNENVERNGAGDGKANAMQVSKCHAGMPAPVPWQVCLCLCLGRYACALVGVLVSEFI